MDKSDTNDRLAKSPKKGYKFRQSTKEKSKKIKSELGILKNYFASPKSVMVATNSAPNFGLEDIFSL